MAGHAGRRLARTVRHVIVGGFFLALLASVIGGFIVWREITTGLPPVDDILEYRPPTATRVYADDRTMIGEFFFERRFLVPLDRIPPVVRASFLAAEDANFYRHNGVDVLGIFRAFIKNMQSGTVVQGGSTITQQVVKSLLLSPEKSYRRKLREIVLAFRLERHLTKDEILYLYLNQVYFGNGAYGIAAAARAYFGKQVEALTVAEGALLAGLLQAPSRYSPARHPERAKARQRYVLERMQDEGYITAEQRVTILREDILLAGGDTAPDKAERAPYYVEHVRRELQDRYGGQAPYQMGLNVYTTVNMRMQAAAEAAVRAGLEELQSERRYSPVERHLNASEIDAFLRSQGRAPALEGRTYSALVTAVHPDSAAIRIGIEHGMLTKMADAKVRSRLERGDVVAVRVLGRDPNGWLRVDLDTHPPVEGALVAIDPMTGHVKAMVGGYDFERSEFNRAVQSQRQPGSAFKPLIYAAVLDRGYTPSSEVFDGPLVIPNGDLPAWSPKNYNDRYYGWTTLREALIHSLNTVTVRVVDSIGLSALMDTLEKFAVFERMPPRNLSIALGSAEVSLLRLTQAYTAFAAGGETVDPIFVSRIEDSEGEILEVTQPRATRVLSPATAYLVTSMLQAVVERGTGRRARALGRPCAGKTGTTNDFRDAWFLGYTPDLVVGVWVGFDEERSLGNGASGGRVAAPIWTRFMEQALKGRPIRDFHIPSDVTFVNVDVATGLRAVAGRPSHLEVFRRGTEPMQSPPVEREPSVPQDPLLEEPPMNYIDGEGGAQDSEIEDLTFTN
jgi:penicillin-binding protein 1A